MLDFIKPILTPKNNLIHQKRLEKLNWKPYISLSPMKELYLKTRYNNGKMVSEKNAAFIK